MVILKKHTHIHSYIPSLHRFPRASCQEGNGKYKLKFICFTCPSTIKIGDIDSDLQSYLVYTNNSKETK